MNFQLFDIILICLVIAICLGGLACIFLIKASAPKEKPKLPTFVEAINKANQQIRESELAAQRLYREDYTRFLQARREMKGLNHYGHEPNPINYPGLDALSRSNIQAELEREFSRTR